MKETATKIDANDTNIQTNDEVRNEEKRATYSYDEVIQSATEYFKGDDLAANVWLNKYALKDSAGNIYEQSPDDMHKRLANEIGRIEKRYKNPVSKEDIYKGIENFHETYNRLFSGDKKGKLVLKVIEE